MGYCVASRGNVLWVIVWQVEAIYYGLMCGEYSYFVLGYFVARRGNL